MGTAAQQHTDNIEIGSGEVYLDVLDADGNLAGERYLGDAVSASLTVETERVQVFSGTGPVAKEIVNKVRQITRRFSITLHDISMENLLLFVGSTEAIESVAATQTAVADEDLTVKKKERWYQLGRSDENPRGIGKIDATAAKTVVTSSDGNTTHEAGDDYIVDPEHGRIFIPAGSAIAEDATVKVDYTPAAAARKRVKTGELKDVLAAVRYLEDSSTGKGRDYYMRKCSLGASGELNLMSRDTEQQLQLVCGIQQPKSGAALYVDGEEQ